jgi:hypothetical protein
MTDSTPKYGNWTTALALVGGTLPPTQLAPLLKRLSGPEGIHVAVCAERNAAVAEKSGTPARS